MLSEIKLFKNAIKMYVSFFLIQGNMGNRAGSDFCEKYAKNCFLDWQNILSRYTKIWALCAGLCANKNIGIGIGR